MFVVASPELVVCGAQTALAVVSAGFFVTGLERRRAVLPRLPLLAALGGFTYWAALSAWTAWQQCPI